MMCFKSANFAKRWIGNQRMQHTRLILTAALSLPALSASSNEVITYDDHVKPILQQSCFNCHNPDKARGGVDLASYGGLMRGGSAGEIVASQDPDGSSLLGVMSHTLEPKMPPNGGKVPDKQLEVIRKWIEQGLRETARSQIKTPKRPKVDLSVGEAAVGRPDGLPPMPVDLPLGPIVHTPRPGALPAIAASPWSPVVAVAGQRQVLVYHTQTGELLGVLPFDYGQPETLRFSWTGKLLMVGGGVGGASGTVALYDIASGREVTRVGEEFDAVLAADLDPTQRIIALGGPGKLVKGYDIATGELIYKLDKHTEWVTAIAFSPDGEYLATGDRNGGLRVWETDSGFEIFTLQGHREAVTGLAWRFDGKLLASTSEDGRAALWEMSEGKQHKAWNAHGGGALSVAFNEQGRLVTTGRDKSVKVWSEAGAMQFEIKPFEGLGMSAAFGTSGKTVIAGDLQGRLIRWSLEDKPDQVSELDSNPPPIAEAIVRVAGDVEAKAQAYARAEAQLDARDEATKQTEQALADANKWLGDTRQAIASGQKLVPQRERERNEAGKAKDAANRSLRDALGRLKTAEGKLRGKQNESGMARQNHRRAEQELKRFNDALIKSSGELEQANKASTEITTLVKQAHTRLDEARAQSEGSKAKADAAKQLADQAYQQSEQAKRRSADQARQAGDALRLAQEAQAQAEEARRVAEQAQKRSIEKPEDEALKQRAHSLTKAADEKAAHALAIKNEADAKAKAAQEAKDKSEALAAKHVQRSSQAAALKLEADAMKVKWQTIDKQAKQLQRQSQDQQRKSDSLLKQFETLTDQAQQASETLAVRAAALSSAEDGEAAAQKEVTAKRGEADQAQQMAEARAREYEQSKQAYEVARQSLDASRKGLKPAEDKLKSVQTQREQAKQQQAQSLQHLQTAEAALKQAEREHLKWQAAPVRLEIDALRKLLAEAKAIEGAAREEVDQRLAERKTVLKRYVQLERQIDSAGDARKAQQAKVDAAKRLEQAATKALKTAQGLIPADPQVTRKAELALEDAGFDLESAEYAYEQLVKRQNALPGLHKKARASLQAAERSVPLAEQALDKAVLKAKAIEEQIVPAMQRYQAMRKAAGMGVITKP